MHIWTWATRLQQLHGYVIFLPPMLLGLALVRLLGERQGVFMLEERSCLCLLGLWEKRNRGDGQVEGGSVVVLQAAAEQHWKL